MTKRSYSSCIFVPMIIIGRKCDLWILLEDRVEQMELKFSKNLGNFGEWVLSKIEALSETQMMLEVWKKGILPLSLSLNHNTRTEGCLPTILMHCMCKCICIWLCLHPKLLIQGSGFGICAVILEFATLCYRFLSQYCNLLWLSINWEN